MYSGISADISNFTFLISDIAIVLLSSSVVALAFMRGVKDKTIYMIPALTVLSAGIAIPLDIREAQTSDFLFFSPEYQPVKLVQRFAFNLSHWLFASQYLKTSLIFPRLFKEIKLEQSFNDAAPQSSVS